MWVYDNDTVSDTFIVDLTKDRDVQDNLPCNFLSVRNDSSLIAFVYLDNRKVGAVQAYSSDPFIGKNFEIIMIKQPDGNNFAIGDLFLQVGKNEQMSSTPYNPSWDLMEENIDVYASGCDNRICYSASNTLELIKYWVNVQSSQIVQRRLDVQGSASLGSYEITFDSETILSGGTPINGEVLETKQYKKIIQNSEFDYSLTNCSIKGWMIDYLLNPNDISKDYTLIVDLGNATYAYDNNLLTETDSANSEATGWKTILEVSFPAKDISRVSALFKVKNNGVNIAYAKIQAFYSGAYHDITTPFSQTGSTWKTFYEHLLTLGLVNVTKLRWQAMSGSGGYSYLRITDMSVFE